MNSMLSRLSEMGQKDSRLIIGLMSGTSLDGLDIALCKIKGCGFTTQIELLQFETIPYQEALKQDIKSVFSKKQVDLEKLTLLNALIANVHAEFILACLKNWKVAASEIDCIASHGQTVYHAPQRLHNLTAYPNATLQLGDGDHLAVKTSIITLSDFRQKHIAAGGEGAPLALYGDCILFASETENRVLLNIGGISNFTFLPFNRNSSSVICSDLGPGNTLIDLLVKKHYNFLFDKDGAIARRGKINQVLLKTLMLHPFFTESFPKSTGPESFNLEFLDKAIADSGVFELNPEDLIATLTQFTAESIACGIKQSLGTLAFSIYVSGGGCHNKFLLEKLQQQLPENTIYLTEEIGINPDAKEAILFALLANETLCGSAIKTGGGPVICMGKICLPA